MNLPARVNYLQIIIYYMMIYYNFILLIITYYIIKLLYSIFKPLIYDFFRKKPPECREPQPDKVGISIPFTFPAGLKFFL